MIVTGHQDLLDQIVDEHDGIDSILLDVADPASIDTVFADATSRHRELNVLINMAGIMLPENLLDPAFLGTAEATITTNLFGPIRMLSAFAPFLAERDDAVIMNVSSGLAFVPLPITPTDNATKAAIHSFPESLRVQLADTGVRVLELIPPAVQTTLLGQQNYESSMPLQDYLDEVMSILATQPDAHEIRVERVNVLRFAEVNGNYDRVLSMLSGH